jgi:hypothetical protein
MSPRRYCYTLLAAALLSLLPVLVLNLLLGRYTMDDGNKARLAAEWQRTSHGIAYLPTSGSDALFKLERLNDELPNINAVIFGASTAQTITADMFPAPMRPYNYAQHGHGLLNAIGEAEVILDQQPQVRWLVLPLDWSIGFLFDEGTPPVVSLDRPDLASKAKKQVTMRERLIDAMSYPRIEGLALIFADILRASNKRGAFGEYFLQAAGDEYRCADGALARDFDTLKRGRCAGLRFDGSANFADSDPVGDAAPLIANALVASSKYAGNLTRTRGAPNPVILQRIAALTRQAEQRGGGVILFMPPLLPGMDRAFLRHPEYGKYLNHTKDELRAWAQREQLVIFDASQSERFACSVSEFIDQHHALSPCYRKIWADYWKHVAHVESGKIVLPAEGVY